MDSSPPCRTARWIHRFGSSPARPARTNCQGSRVQEGLRPSTIRKTVFARGNIVPGAAIASSGAITLYAVSDIAPSSILATCRDMRRKLRCRSGTRMPSWTTHLRRAQFAYTKRTAQNCGDKDWRNNTRERESDAQPVELPYRRRHGIEPGTFRLNVVPPAFAAGISKLATRIGESFLDPVAETSAGFEPACVFGRVPCTPTGIRPQNRWKRPTNRLVET